ncbi:MAG: DUF1092 family protein [Leptolyngbyaceae cyanobacterium SL_7_1]|nr:DUF1092 family protein [Leptolyngbyaceae cyanobacterium SL_7_1]
MPVIWELDFYSRPVLDEDQKKLWEVLICESPLQINTPLESLFRYCQFCPSGEVNSVQLRSIVETAIAQAPKPPDKIRFFRRQMNNMIIKACQDAGLPVYPSRRTLALHRWIQQRMVEVYPQLPTYQAATNPSVGFPSAAPQPLPDALRGQQWALVNLEVDAFAEMPEWQIDFGEAFPLELGDVMPRAQIPGLIIFSPRAIPLAAWMSGLEMGFLRYDADTSQMLLETGASDAWIVANVSKPALKAEAERFEVAKQQANQVHFLAVQSHPNAESFAGFWLMQKVDLA